MASQLEQAKYNSLLLKQEAIQRFQALYKQVRLRSLTSNLKASEGEIMAVCAYLAGREFAGSSATQDACMRLGCMTAKTFSRVLKDVQPLTRAKPIPKGPSLTIYSLAQKYGFGQGELEKALAVHNVLSMHIHSTQMHDERIVCAIFAVLCDSMGYSIKSWLEEEMKLHNIEKKEMNQAIANVNRVHKDQIKTIVQTWGNSGRPTRHQRSPIKKPPSLPAQTAKASAGLKRAAEDPAIKVSSVKRRKAETRTSPILSISSSHHSGSPVPGTQASALSQQSNPSLVELLEEEEQDDELEEEEEEIEEIESGSIHPYISGSAEEDLDWATLAEFRRKAIVQKTKGGMDSHHIAPASVFADRAFWSST